MTSNRNQTGNRPRRGLFGRLDPAYLPDSHFSLSWTTNAQDHLSGNIQDHSDAVANSFTGNTPVINEYSVTRRHPVDCEEYPGETSQNQTDNVDHLVPLASIREYEILPPHFDKDAHLEFMETLLLKQTQLRSSVFVVAANNGQDLSSEQKLERDLELLAILKSDLESELKKFECVAANQEIDRDDVQKASSRFKQQVTAAQNMEILKEGWTELSKHENVMTSIELLQNATTKVMLERIILEEDLKKRLFETQVAASLSKEMVEDLISFD